MPGRLPRGPAAAAASTTLTVSIMLADASTVSVEGNEGNARFGTGLTHTATASAVRRRYGLHARFGRHALHAGRSRLRGLSALEGLYSRAPERDRSDATTAAGRGRLDDFDKLAI